MMLRHNHTTDDGHNVTLTQPHNDNVMLGDMRQDFMVAEAETELSSDVDDKPIHFSI